jgi:hypothetical protein
MMEAAEANRRPLPAEAANNPTGGHWGRGADIVIAARSGRLARLSGPHSARCEAVCSAFTEAMRGGAALPRAGPKWMYFSLWRTGLSSDSGILTGPYIGGQANIAG